MLALVYFGYAASRVLADDTLAPAVARAVRILDMERLLRLDVERGLNRWFLEHDTVGVAASFYYAGAHYVLTLLVVVWLFHRHRDAYAPPGSPWSAARRSPWSPTSRCRPHHPG